MSAPAKNGNGQKVLSYWQTALLVIVPLGSAGVAYMNLQITAAVEQPKRESAQLVVEVDRLTRKLDEESKALAILQAQLSGEIAERRSKEVEVETQFRAADQAKNVQFAEYLRTTSLLWEKTFPGSHFPDQAFYPSIAK